MALWLEVGNLKEIVNIVGNFLWGGPLLVAFFLVGLYQTWLIKGIQFSCLAKSFGLIFTTFCNKNNKNNKDKNREKIDTDISDANSAKGDISTFEALMTALAGAIGTGNITGIATAVTIGGLGSLFWMWVMACLSMATAYSETILAIKYRKENECGNIAGGPMYYLVQGLKAPKLAFIYAFFASLAALGIGCLVQSNSVVDAIVSLNDWQQYRLLFGIILAGLTGMVVISGVKSIGRAAGILVPFMAITYIAVSLFILCWHYDRLLQALSLIITSAFNGQAAIGGFAGSTILLAMQNGVQYGVFANEAGLGSLAIAGSSAKINNPVEQGLRSIAGVFLATMIICTLTGLVLAVTKIVGLTDVNGGLIKGSPLAMAAFGSVVNWFRYVVVGGLILFAFTTMLAWAYYGEKSCEYLLGVKSAIAYRWIFTGCVVLGAILNLEFVWAIANLANVFIAIPNLIGIMALSKDVRQITREYFSRVSNKLIMINN